MKVKEERFCDVTFTFPDSPAGQGQVVKAQKNALIANSPVFEVHILPRMLLLPILLMPGPIRGGFLRCILRVCPDRGHRAQVHEGAPSVYLHQVVESPERLLCQVPIPRFLPLLSLRQAFEMLYLARKYLIEDLENYTKNFILNNKQTLAGVTDVFLYLEMNVKVKSLKI